MPKTNETLSGVGSEGKPFPVTFRQFTASMIKWGPHQAKAPVVKHRVTSMKVLLVIRYLRSSM